MGIDDFKPLYVSNIYLNSKKKIKNKAWATPHNYASTRAELLDLLPKQDSSSFI